MTSYIYFGVNLSVKEGIVSTLQYKSAESSILT